MKDEYVHSDCNLIYIDENIPGPFEKSVEYDNILSNFNSWITNICNCHSICTVETCKCLMRSGGANYVTYIDESNSRLNFLKEDGNHSSYPIIECNSLCNCSEYCGNRVVQKGPIRGLVVQICTSLKKGEGLFTAQTISKGAFICEYAGEVITLEQAKKRHEINEMHRKMNYIFCLNEYCNETQLQMIVDPSRIGNVGRYINHSCQPNCIILPVRVDNPLPKLAIFALNEIPAGSELTYDYGSNSFSNPDRETKKTCLCGSKNCRGFMPSEQY